MLLTGLTVLMFLVAVVFSMLGLGGGVLYTPIQVWAGIDFHRAATTSLFLIMLTSMSASIVFRRAKKIDWPLALVLEVSTALGGFLGGLCSGAFSGASLSVLFALVIVLASSFMLRPIPAKPAHGSSRAGEDGPSRVGPACRVGLDTSDRLATDCDRGLNAAASEMSESTINADAESSFWSWHRTLGDQRYSVNLAIALPVSLAAGLVSGLIGVGGGILKVPMMVLLFRIPMDIAVGSSALMVGVTAAGGFAGHVTSGHWDWQTSLVLGVAVFAGGQLGSRISVGLDKKKLKKGFGWFLLLIAALMLLRPWLVH